jgi:predicted ester cyclase
LQPLAVRTMPLDVAPPRATRFGSPLELSRVHWVRPELVVEVNYLTWTLDNLLRQVAYVGLREDSRRAMCSGRFRIPRRAKSRLGSTRPWHRENSLRKGGCLSSPFGSKDKASTMDHTAKLIVRRFIETVVNTGNLDQVAAFVAPDTVDEMTQHILAVRSTYPDLQVTVGQQIAEGDWVVTRITARGTHAGTYCGIPPTNKQIVIEGVNVDRIVNGMLVEHGGAANSLEALVAIGALPLSP